MIRPSETEPRDDHSFSTTPTELLGMYRSVSQRSTSTAKTTPPAARSHSAGRSDSGTDANRPGCANMNAPRREKGSRERLFVVGLTGVPFKSDRENVSRSAYEVS